MQVRLNRVRTTGKRVGLPHNAVAVMAERPPIKPLEPDRLWEGGAAAFDA